MVRDLPHRVERELGRAHDTEAAPQRGDDPRTTASTLPLSPLIVDGSSSGNIFATSLNTDCLSEAGRTQARTVTSTMNSGKIEKIPQNAIIDARFELRSSENFLNVATATPAGLLSCWVRSTLRPCACRFLLS